MSRLLETKLWAPLLLLTMLLVYGCGAGTEGPEAEEQPEEQTEAAEQAEQGAQDQTAAQKDAKDAKPEAIVVPEEFDQDTVGIYSGPLRREASAPPPATPYDEAFPPPNRKDPTVRVAVLSHAKRPQSGEYVGLLVGTIQRDWLESQLGRPLDVVVVSREHHGENGNSVIRFRKGYLKPAMLIATLMPEFQIVQPMSPSESEVAGVDVLILTGHGGRN
jgi:hypothetical protein